MDSREQINEALTTGVKVSAMFRSTERTRLTQFQTVTVTVT